MIEACLAMGVICLVFFGLFQLSQLAAAREVINHAAARGARAKSVGLSRFMVSKAIRVALTKCFGNISKAAEMLGITRPTLYDLLNKYGLNSDSYSKKAAP